MAIKGFKSKALKRLMQKGDCSGVSPQSAMRIAEILEALNGPNPMEALSARTYKLHPLTGNRKGCFAVTVTGNRRITFRCDGEHAYDIDLVDYHYNLSQNHIPRHLSYEAKIECVENKRVALIVDWLSVQGF